MRHAAVIVIGYTPRVMPGVEDYLVRPSAPGQYKKPESVKEWETTIGQQRWEALLYESAFSKLTGGIKSIFAMDLTHRQMFDSLQIEADDPGTLPSVAFWRWIADYYRDSADTLLPVCLGFGLKEFFRVSGVEALRAGEPVSLDYWYRNETGFNPYEMLVEAERRDALPMANFLRLLGVDTPTDWLAHRDPKADVTVTARILEKCRLFSRDTVPTDEVLETIRSLSQPVPEPSAAKKPAPAVTSRKVPAAASPAAE